MIKRSLSLLIVISLIVSAFNVLSLTALADSGKIESDVADTKEAATQSEQASEVLPEAVRSISMSGAHVDRLYALETSNSLVYKNSDGTNTAYIFPNDIEQMNSDSQIVENTADSSSDLSINDVINGQNNIDDACIVKGGTTPSGTNSSMVVGNFNGNIQRALIKLPGLYNSTTFTSLDEENIVEVKYNMYYSLASGNVKSSVHEYLGEWEENSVVYSDEVWNNCKIIPIWQNLYLISSSDYLSVDITSLAKSWKKFQNGNVYEANPQKGFMFKLEDESEANNFIAFQTSEETISAYSPYISITYVPKVEITLNGEEIDSISVNEGDSFTGLSVSSSVNNPNVVWTSSDTSIATVTSGGTVQGLKAGKVTLSAIAMDSESTSDVANMDSITVYVTIPDGVYTLKNLKSGRVMDVPNSIITPQTNVIQWSMYSATNSNQVWEITYIGEGKYFVQSGITFDIGLYKSETGNVCVNNVVKPKDITEIDENSIWTISYLSTSSNVSQYSFKCNGDDACALTVENSSTSSNAKIVTDSIDTTDNSFYWSLVERENVPGTGIRFVSLPQVDGYNAIVAGTYGAVEVEVFPNHTDDFLVDWETSGTVIGMDVAEVEDLFTAVVYAEEEHKNTTNTFTASLRNNSNVSCSVDIDNIPVDHGIYYIDTTIAGSAKCVDANNTKATDETKIILNSKTASVSKKQSWTVTYAGSHYYYITSRMDDRFAIGKAIEDDEIISKLHIIKPTVPSQKWKFVASGTGYKFQNESNVYLDYSVINGLNTLVIGSSNDGTNVGLEFTFSSVGASPEPNIAELEEWRDEYGELWLCNNSIFTFSDITNVPSLNIWNSSNYDQIKFNINDLNDLEVVVFYGDGEKVTVSSESISNAVGENKPARDTKTFNITPVPDNVQSGLKVFINNQYKYLSRSIVNDNMVLVDELTTKYKFEYIKGGYYAIVTPENYALTVSVNGFSHKLLGTEALNNQLWRIEKTSSGYALKPKIQPNHYLAVVNGNIQLSESIFGDWQITMIDYHLTMVDETDKRDRMSGYVEGIRAASNGIMYNFIYHDEVMESEFISLLGSTTGVVMIRTHGTESNKIYTADNYGMNTMHSSEIQSVTASVVIYGCCFGGKGEATNTNNFVNTTVAKGMNSGNGDVVAVGFIPSVFVTHANRFAKEFIECTSEGLSYQDALNRIYKNFPQKDDKPQLYIVGVEITE